jgi:branched-chain amino acid transport system ATP-binding protein
MLLEANNLRVGYGDATALWDVSFDVADGEIVSIIGPNGAGKTTLINAVAGLLKPQAGSLQIGGRELGKLPAHAFCHNGIALVPEGRRLFATMTVEENLEIGCYRPGARRLFDETLEYVFGLFPILRERRKQVAGLMSGGQQQMVAISRALMAKPKILLLDEPSLGLAPAIVDDMFEAISAVNRTGVAILLVEQNVGKALSIAQRAYVIEQGRIVTSGKPEVLMRQSDIQAAYLGL